MKLRYLSTCNIYYLYLKKQKNNISTLIHADYIDKFYPLYITIGINRSSIVTDQYAESLIVGEIKVDIEHSQYIIKICTNNDMSNFAIYAIDTVITYKDYKLKDVDTGIFGIDVISYIDISQYLGAADGYTRQVKDLRSIMCIDIPEVMNMYEDFYSAHFTGNTIRKYAYMNNPTYCTKGEPIYE